MSMLACIKNKKIVKRKLSLKDQTEVANAYTTFICFSSFQGQSNKYQSNTGVDQIDKPTLPNFMPCA